ncbi:hypothetical protein, partial [Phenylobacterium sp.]|uniref:hypothetical protein n=1 Tax=Phenylobacterium sp. TaxID=1871053 RepID=UPI0025F21B5A
NGSDIQKWISGQLGEVVRDTDFKIDTCVTLTKTADPVAVNTLQRDALFKVYGANNGSQAYGLFEFNRDYGLNRWGDEHQVSWVQVGTDLPSSDKPKLNPNVAREVANLADVDQIIDGIVSAIIPGDCGRMTSHSQKLLTLGNWPEFMVEWVPAHIKVGCSEIVISLPVIRTRISSLNFYFYYSVPSNTGSFVIRICATCGERAALTGAILGLISTQIELAVPTFVELFTRCAESEIKRCVDPGLLLLIESDGPWR